MGINVATISGNVGQEPEVRYTATNKTVANFSVAVQTYKQGQKGSFWVECTAWEKTAELIKDYVHKGSSVTVSGNLDVEKWKAQDGTERSKTVLVVRDIQLPPKDHSVGYDSEPAF